MRIFFILIFFAYLCNLNVITMDLQRAQKLVEDLMKKHLDEGDNPWRFKFDNARRRFGSCRWGRGGYWVTLSKHLVLLNDESQVRDTILHEIAHAMDVNDRGYSNHDANWRQIALNIGCNGVRCYSSKEVTQPEFKYKTLCNTCGKEGKAMRQPRRSSTACGKCCREHNGGKYDPKYNLVYIQNY